MGKKIVELGGKELATILKERFADFPDDLEVLHSTARIELPGMIKMLCASHAWDMIPEGTPVPVMRLVRKRDA